MSALVFNLYNIASSTQTMTMTNLNPTGTENVSRMPTIMVEKQTDVNNAHHKHENNDHIAVKDTPSSTIKTISAETCSNNSTSHSCVPLLTDIRADNLNKKVGDNNKTYLETEDNFTSANNTEDSNGH